MVFIDGRVTQTVATLEGNKLTKVQTGTITTTEVSRDPGGRCGGGGAGAGGWEGRGGWAWWGEHYIL